MWASRFSEAHASSPPDNWSGFLFLSASGHNLTDKYTPLQQDLPSEFSVLGLFVASGKGWRFCPDMWLPWGLDLIPLSVHFLLQLRSSSSMSSSTVAWQVYSLGPSKWCCSLSVNLSPNTRIEWHPQVTNRRPVFDLVQAVLGRRVGYSPQEGGWNKHVVAAAHICRRWVHSQPSVLTVLGLEGNPARIKGCITWNMPPLWEELGPGLLLFHFPKPK